MHQVLLALHSQNCCALRVLRKASQPLVTHVRHSCNCSDDRSLILQSWDEFAPVSGYFRMSDAIFAGKMPASPAGLEPTRLSTVDFKSTPLTARAK